METSAPNLEFDAPSPQELQPLLPAYEIRGFIAKGGMGAVYYARQISLDRPVAIKILPRQFGADPQFRASFEAEAKAMARLNHPNLIAVYDFGDADGMLYIVMELVRGKSLHHSAHGKRIEQVEAARVVAGLCRGLAHAHRAGILHRDIKPGNILLGTGAHPKLGDFGLARPLGAEHNPDEIVWGTPGYSAPEVIDHPHAVDQRADVFAVGVLLYELLTAKLPSDPWQPPSKIAHCDPAFDRIIRRATHPSVEQRYPGADDLATDLEDLIKRLSRGIVQRSVKSADPPKATLKPVAPSFSLNKRPLAPAVPAKKSSAGPVLIGALGLSILAIGAVIIAAASKRDAEPDRSPEEPATSSVEPPPRPKPTPVADRPNRRPKPKVENPTPTESQPSPRPKPDRKPTESTAQVLARLKAQLKSGDLSELPPAATRRGTETFLLVEQPLRWQAAYHFAEDHGAQLAVLENADDLAWAQSQFLAESPVWLGLSDSGMESKWHWVNGQPVEDKLWADGQPDNTASPAGSEDFAAMLVDGSLDDLSGLRELPFLLQWNQKSENRGSIAQQLKRTRETLQAGRAPIFPAGAHNVGGSRFLLVPHSMPWERAVALANDAGGHLAVPSTSQEAAWILDALKPVLGGGDGCWIGARRKSASTGPWTFSTGEKFEFVTWAPEQPDLAAENHDVLQVWRGIDGQFGYRNATGEAQEANYFLVEWSAPSRRNMPTEAERKWEGFTAREWLTDQREATVERESVAYERWKRRHEKNLEDFTNDIESEVDTARRQEVGALRKIATQFTDQIKKSGRVPDEIPDLAERFVGRIHKRALERQIGHWDEYQPEFAKAQDRYLADVKAERDRRQRRGHREDAAYLARELKAAAQKAYFIDILDGNNPEVPETDEDEGE